MTDENADDETERHDLDISATPQEFMDLIGGLGQMGATAVQYQSPEVYKRVSTLQQRILKNNPELAEYAMKHEASQPVGDVSDMLEEFGLDPEDVGADQHDDDTDDGVEIDIE